MKKILDVDAPSYVKAADAILEELMQTRRRTDRPEEDFDRFEDEYEKGYGR
jgi:hypothetical protein